MTGDSTVAVMAGAAFDGPVVVDLRQLVARHQVALWRYVRALGAAPDLAEELVQDTFVTAWRRGLEDRGEAAVATFLRRTARHLYLRNRRAAARIPARVADDVDDLWLRTCGHDGGEQWLAALRACVDGLDERPRLAVRLWYGRGDDSRDRAAAELGLRPNGLKTLLQRVRGLLRECVERRLGEER